MRTRTFTLIAVLALVLAACSTGGDAGDDSTASTEAPAETTTTVTGAPDAVELSYSLEPGMSFSYEVDLNQTIDLTAEGDASAMGDEEIPGEMSVNLSGTAVMTHSVEEGPEPETYAINITGDLSDLEITGTVDGEPVTGEDIPEFATMEPIDVTIVVDEQGNIIPDDSSGLGEDFLGDMGGLGGLDALGQLGPGGDAGQFVGPPFSEEEVTVGDTWSDTVEVPTMPGDDPITTQIESEVVRTDTVEGNEVFVIETTTTTSAIEFDLAEFFAGFMSAFIPEDASEEDLAELEAITSELRFAFAVDETVANLTTWFDYEAGLARQAEFDNSTRIVFDINVPDEESGEMVEFAMDMTVTSDIAYRLTEASGA
ncbi:MAG: hypothetical protein PVJ28_05165 [Acidimicrobiia bacterium]|jgi:hypothetical protein